MKYEVDSLLRITIEDDEQPTAQVEALFDQYSGGLKTGDIEACIITHANGDVMQFYCEEDVARVEYIQYQVRDYENQEFEFDLYVLIANEDDEEIKEQKLMTFDAMKTVALWFAGDYSQSWVMEDLQEMGISCVLQEVEED